MIHWIMKVLEILLCNNHYFVKRQAFHYNFFYIKTLISVLSLLLGWTVYWFYLTRSYFYTLGFPKDLIEWNIFFYWGLIPNMSVLNCNFHSLTCLTYTRVQKSFITKLAHYNEEMKQIFSFQYAKYRCDVILYHHL